MAITQKQQRFLFERLDQVKNSKPSRYDSPSIPETPAVKAARQRIEKDNEIVKAHEKKSLQYKTRRSQEIADTVMVIKEAILFGDPDKARKMIDAFDKKKF